jgi:DNA polymerase-3 subunit delta'
MGAAERETLVRVSGGSIGAALALAEDDGLALAEEADRLVGRASSPDMGATLALADKLSRINEGADRFGQFLIEALTNRIRARAMAGGAGLDRWTALLERLNRSFLRTSALHLDPRQTILSADKAISDTARRARL